MAILKGLDGSKKIKQNFQNIPDDIAAVNEQLEGHVDGTSDKHNASDIVDDSSVTVLRVKDALDSLQQQLIDATIGAGTSPAEVTLARTSNVYGSFPSLKERCDNIDTLFGNFNVISAIGSGADPTGITDSSVAIQAMFDSLTSGQKVSFEPGDYRLDATINIDGTGRFDNYEGLEIIFSTDAKLKINHAGIGLDFSNIKRLYLEKGLIYGIEQVTSVGIKITNVVHLDLEEFVMRQLYAGILADGDGNALYCSLQNSVIFGCEYGVKTQNSANEVKIIGGRITQNRVNIRLEDVNGGIVMCASTEGAEKSIEIIDSQHLTLINNRLENPNIFYPGANHYGIWIDELSSDIDIMGISTSESNFETVHIEDANPFKDTINIGYVGKNNLSNNIKEMSDGRYPIQTNLQPNPLFDNWTGDFPDGTTASNVLVLAEKIQALQKGTNAMKLTSTISNGYVNLPLTKDTDKENCKIVITYRAEGVNRINILQSGNPSAIKVYDFKTGFNVDVIDIDDFDVLYQDTLVGRIYPDLDQTGGFIIIDSIVIVKEKFSQHGYFTDEPRVNVRIFDVLGDGTDESIKINAMMLHLGIGSLSDGFTLYFPKGSYVMAGIANVNKKITAEGDGIDTDITGTIASVVFKNVGFSGAMKTEIVTSSPDGTNYIIGVANGGAVTAIIKTY